MTMKYPYKIVGLGVLSAFALSACADGGGVARNKTVTGAGIGAGAGAIAGLVLGDEKKDIGIGAAAGAVIGGVVGYTLDRQEAALRNSLSTKEATIQNTGSELIVTLPEGITFASNSTYVRDDIRPEIYKIANNLREYPNTTVDVIGHTDSTGSEEYNQALSADRAYSVTNILKQRGVSESRIVSYGRGETSPVATNDTEYGKAKNRRVEIVIRPTG